MKIITNGITGEVYGVFPDSDTITIDNDTGLTVNGSVNPQIRASGWRIIEDVTAEQFLLGVNLLDSSNHEWRYHAR